MNLRFADEHDAAACLAIYAQYIDTSITFETALPSEDEFAGRIRSYGAVYPWLIERRLHAPHLHPRHAADAGKCSRKDG